MEDGTGLRVLLPIAIGLCMVAAGFEVAAITRASPDAQAAMAPGSTQASAEVLRVQPVPSLVGERVQPVVKVRNASGVDVESRVIRTYPAGHAPRAGESIVVTYDPANAARSLAGSLVKSFRRARLYQVAGLAVGSITGMVGLLIIVWPVIRAPSAEFTDRLLRRR